MQDPLPFSPASFHDELATGAVGRFLLYRPSVDSTMVLARREADEGAPHGTLVLAEEQTAGRGRRGRSFHSPAGQNLYFTLVLRLDAPAAERLTLAVPVAVAAACRACTGLPVQVKWPNDIWLGERKICGMLIDAVSAGSDVVAMPGIGINVNGDPTANPELQDIATSLRRESGVAVPRERLLAGICNELEALLAVSDAELARRYRELSLVLGRRVTVDGAGVRSDGVALDVDARGALLVRLDSGDERAFSAGEVSLRPA